MEKKLNNLIEDFHKLFCKAEELILKKNAGSLTLNEFRIIKTIGTQKILITDLSQIFHITTGAILISLNNIEEKGFLEKIQDEDDRRKIYVRLIDKGLERIQSHNNAYKKIISETTQSISAEELENMEEYFGKIKKNLEEISIDFHPKELNMFSENEKLKVTEIHGLRGMQNFYSINGIRLGQILEIIEKNEKRIKLKINNKIVEMDLHESIGLLAISNAM